jgi:predicted dehydrogenase
MSDEPIPVGVIGVGSMGVHHARAYAELRGSRLVGVHDADAERAREVADRHGTEARAVDDLLGRAAAVSIAVPTAYHYEMARRAIDRGVAPLVEKPFVGSLERGQELIDRADERDVPLQVGHVERFNPAVRTLADVVPDLEVLAIDARRLGPPRPSGRPAATAATPAGRVGRDRAPPRRVAPRRPGGRRGPPLDRTDEAGVVRDLMIHDLDIALSVVGAEPTSVDAERAPDDRYVTATVGFENGVAASFRASRVTQRKVRTLTVTARDCTVEVDYIDRSIQIHRHSLPEYVETNGDVRYRHESVIERPTVENGEPLKAQLRAFLAAVRGERTPPVSGRDGLRALALARDVERTAGSPHGRKRTHEAP